MIALIHINYSDDHSEKILPLGILSVGSALKRAGFAVELFAFTEKEIDHFSKEIVARNPEWIGISVMTGSQTRHSAIFSKVFRKLSNAPIVWGGIHPSLMPWQCINEEYIDYLMIGEGEETVLEFARKIQDKQSIDGIKGLAYKKNGQVVIGERRPLIQNLDQWRIDFSLLDLNKFVYKQGGYERVLAYKSSRGCPFRCSFCYNLNFNESKWRAWSVKSVAEDMAFIKERYRIDAVKFYDDNFFVDKKRAFDVLEAINLPAHVEVRIDSIDDGLAQKLKHYKCFDMLIGVESGSNRLLKLISKNFTIERTMKSVASLAKYNLPAVYSTIVGLPTETKEELDETIELMYRIYKAHPRGYFTLGAYLPYPGSAMYQTAIKEGFLPPQITEDWGSIDRFRQNFKSPWVDVKKVWRIREYFKFFSYHLGPLNKWFEFRIKHRFFAVPLDIYIIEFLAGIAIEEKWGVGKVMRKIHSLFRRVWYKDIPLKT
ncbi:MAG: hypothetical protein COU81_03850 [Candidatus Portnoybacteria bacterium CG10_big_fil_rev_8_21_14_0_10_36_7]|uniref:Uncharacterized protein n=1 Tax=Candidatus Portnoybacteria bacterium CG10_big_fil_rev_8_21_14_0_10_36_7 TaxID=1974812 RepID=A0A2M8KD69_9BACT|nr:MAG: hypothetical protein COU81_03850 [Candidatus Portnoybacteria bacterium CG10_big_fil_rev_8_21_14_0_10_36_7]